MFVYNVKLNSKNIVKVSLILISIVIIFFFVISLYKILSSSFKVDDDIPEPDVAYISTADYTNVLKSVYENVDVYLGQKISFTGYVFRCLDFSENQFVLARDMLVDGRSDALIVGFLCSSNDASSYQDGTWVEITGEITKGFYNGEIPIIKVTKIKQVDKPADEFTYPPDSTYIPTSVIY